MIHKQLQEIGNREERISFLVKNKKQAIAEKKANIKAPEEGIRFSPIPVKGQKATKADGSTAPIYKIVGNSIGFMDSHMDVSMPGSFNKTVQESGSMVYILNNHDHSPQAIFAENKGVFVEQMTIRELGYDAAGSTEVLTANISPIYDEKMADKYANGEIKQHSVGIRYVKIELAVDDETESDLYANWTKYIGQVINREEAEKNGYFWAVKEQQLLEISAVLWGSNCYTPVASETDKQRADRLEKELKSLKDKSRESTPEQEPIKIDLVEIYQKSKL